MRLTIACGILLGVVSVEPTQAQARDTVLSGPHAYARQRFTERLLLGYWGEIPGTFVGATIGYNIERSSFNCECDDPGLAGLLLGGAAGALLGASLVAALPSHTERCTFGGRWLRGLTGAVVSAIPPALVLAAMGEGGYILLTPFVMAPIGSATALRRC